MQYIIMDRESTTALMHRELLAYHWLTWQQHRDDKALKYCSAHMLKDSHYSGNKHTAVQSRNLFLGDQFLEVSLPEPGKLRKLIEFSEHLSRLCHKVLVLKTVNTIRLNFLRLWNCLYLSHRAEWHNCAWKAIYNPKSTAVEMEVAYHSEVPSRHWEGWKQ